MYLPPFDYVRPGDTAEAVALLAQYGEDASVYMGGTELLLLMKLGLAAPRVLVDCKGVDELTGIELEGARLRIGAGSTHRQLEYSGAVRAALPDLADLVARIGNVRVRSAGTIGGNLCFADPHSDPTTLLIALGASVQLVSAAGVREVACADLVTGPYETVLALGELMTALIVPIPSAGSRVAYERIGFRERPIVTVALVRGPAGTRVVAGGGGRSAARIAAAESILAETDGLAYEARSALADAAQAVAQTLDPTEDLDGDAGYKRQLVRVAFQRAARRVEA